MRSDLDGFAVNLEMWWTDLEPLDRIEAAAATGFGAVEIWFWRRWDVSELARRAAGLGLAVAQIGGWDFEPRLGDPDVQPGFEDGIGRAIEAAHLLGAPRINLNGPYLRPGEDPADVRNRVADALSRVVSLAEDAGVTLMVEPMNLRVDHPGYSLPTSADVVAVCTQVGSDALGVNWDLYHLQISEGDLSGHVAEHRSHVAYLQVADHPGRHEPGTGEIDYRFLLPFIRRLGYDGPIGLECSPATDPESAVARIARLGRLLHEAGETA